MKNLENCKLVLEQIENHPETWNQQRWHCETSHCFAGWAQILSGKPANDDTVRRDARIFLGLSLREADYYFYANRNLKELKTVLKDFYDEDGYDQEGLDREGYNRDGYDRYGDDRYGYDQYGYDREGYDQDGYNREGYDRYGYNREGYDRYGYDQYGYDREGLDINNNLKI